MWCVTRDKQFPLLCSLMAGPYKNHQTAMRTRTMLLLLVIIAISGVGKIVAFRYTYRLDPTRMLVPDSASYLHTAYALLQIGHLAAGPAQPNLPQIERTPGYPVFLAFLFWAFGITLAPVVYAQIALSLGTILMTYVLARQLWQSSGAAVLASALLAFDMLSFVHTQYILTETLFTSFLCVSLLACMYVLRSDHRSAVNLFLAGSLVAFTTLIRPITYYLVIPLLILLGSVMKIRQNASWKNMLGRLGVFLIPWLVVVGGWQWRNYALTGSATISAIQGVNLLFYRGASILAQQQHYDFEAARQKLGYEEYQTLRADPHTTGPLFAEGVRQWAATGRQLIYQHPWLCLSDQFSGALRLLFETAWDLLPTYLHGQPLYASGPIGDMFHLSARQYVQRWMHDRPLAFALFSLAMSYLIAVYGSGFVVIIRIIPHARHAWPLHGCMGLVAGYLVVISAGPEACARFRVPLMPIFCVYAGYGIFSLYHHVTHQARS